MSLRKISQEAVSLADHQKESAATRMVLRMSLEVTLERIDSFGQNGDLNFC